MNILEQILTPNRFLNPYKKQHIKSLFEKLSVLLDFLEDSSRNSSEEVKLLATKIRDASRICNRILSQSKSSLRQLFSKLSMRRLAMEHRKKLQKIIQQFDSIMEEVVNITDRSGVQNLQPRNFLPSRPVPSGQSNMVGFHEDLEQIKDQLCGGQSKLQTIPVIGMCGIGKTTLVKNAYNDSFVACHFYIRAWITLSPEYCRREILLGLLDEIVVFTDKMREELDEKLVEHVYKSLKGKRYLIVVEDVSSIELWKYIKMLFPDDNNGSRIILTTRLTDVANYVSSSNTHHHMRFLNKQESWSLFLENVFGEKNCPPELEDVGMKIARNCQGLPLVIVVIGGLLSKVNKAQYYWEYVAENLSSIIAEKDDMCSVILTLSYTHLPAHLKACFLYMGIFPENYEIPVSRLIKLWVAEGFLKSNREKHLEEVAEEYLTELISRNLILVRERGSTGKIKTCSMHDLLRQLCVRMAHDEKFLCVKTRHRHNFPEEAGFKRRMSIHDDASYGINEEITMQSMSLVRSFIYIGRDDTGLLGYYYFGFRLLKVLDMVEIELITFPEEILQLVNLRYIAITCYGEVPSSITIFRNLQTLIIEDPLEMRNDLPPEIWNMLQLRHLKMSRVYLPDPVIAPVGGIKCFILENLETLSLLDDFKFSKEVLDRIPNLKKLGIHHGPFFTREWSYNSLSNFVLLQKLEMLKFVFGSLPDSTFLQSITFPARLKKITLEGGRIGWENMTIFGSLPNLEVLKLRDFAFVGPEWVPTADEFCKLKYLLIWGTDLVYWRADYAHFPSLEHLILRNCSNLVEIPSGIGEILTLEIIEIDDSSPSVVSSTKKIQEEQQSLGNDSLQVLIHPKKTELNHFKNLANEGLPSPAGSPVRGVPRCSSMPVSPLFTKSQGGLLVQPLCPENPLFHRRSAKDCKS